MLSVKFLLEFRPLTTEESRPDIPYCSHLLSRHSMAPARRIEVLAKHGYPKPILEAKDINSIH
jgi:hypothetical protein